MRAIAGTALALVLLPLLVEAVAISPAHFASYEDPLSAAIRLVLANVTPYWAAAISCATWALLVPRLVSPRPVFSRWLAVAALALALLAAYRTSSLEDALLEGRLRLGDDHVRQGAGASLAPSFSIVPVPLESAGRLVQRDLEPSREPRDATVRWVGLRTGTESGRSVELVAGGFAHDVTDAFASLRPGEARIFTRRIRVGPGPARVHLRLANNPIQPAVFFRADRAREARGVALDSGGGDALYRSATSRAGPDALGPPRMSVEGLHRPGGYAVVVLSGEEWESHDLGALVRARGELELALSVDSQPVWDARLIGPGVESEAVSLTRFRSDIAVDGSRRFRTSLRTVDWRDVAPANVVGVALVYVGPAGPIHLQLQSVRVVPSEQVESGWAIAATPAIDANFEVPRDGLFAVGGPDGIPALDDHVVHLRLLAALLAVSAALGPGLFWTAVRARPVAFLLSVPTGAVAATALDVVLPSFLEPALEHLAVGLGAVALATLITALRRGGSRVVPSRPDESSASPGRSERLAWLDALRGLAILGVIGIHVTADSAGLPFAAAEPDGRLVPMVARAVFTALNYPVFLLASFFALAHVLERRRRTYREIVGDRARRLLVPLAVWTLLFVVVRHLKAHAFGYQDAYRAELSSGASWLSYFVLGSAQYHLHFLPLLFGLTLCYPLYRFATWRPWLGGCVLATLALWPLLDRAAYEHVASPEIREYVLRATKTFAYLGYGLYAFALHALHQRGIAAGVRRGILLASTVVGSAAVAILVGHGIETALEGRWLPLGFAVHMARYVLPAVVFTLALAAEGVSPRWLRHLGGLSMGVYLFHPVVLDALEVLQRGYELSPATTTALNFAVVSIVSGVTVSVAQRSKTTARLFFVPAELRR